MKNNMDFKSILSNLIEKYKLTDLKQEILNLAQETIILRNDEEENYSKLGNTRVFGFPDLPILINKEEFKNKEWYFVAQINLTETPDNEYLPKNGMLYFFTDTFEAKVFYFPNISEKELLKYDKEKNIINAGYFPEGMKVKIEKILTLPYPSDFEDQDDSLANLYNDLHEEFDEVIGDYEASILGYFWCDHNIRGFNPRTGENILKKYKNSILLFNNMDPLGRQQYFLINKVDLKENKFNNIYYNIFAS
jgi:uncharacterized protein YwqG